MTPWGRELCWVHRGVGILTVNICADQRGGCALLIMDIFWCVLIAVGDNKMHKEKEKLMQKAEIIKNKMNIKAAQ